MRVWRRLPIGSKRKSTPASAPTADVALRERSRIYLILNGIDKRNARELIDTLMEEMIQVAADAGALDRLLVKVQHTSLPTTDSLPRRFTGPPGGVAFALKRSGFRDAASRRLRSLAFSAKRGCPLETQ